MFWDAREEIVELFEEAQDFRFLHSRKVRREWAYREQLSLHERGFWAGDRAFCKVCRKTLKRDGSCSWCEKTSWKSKQPKVAELAKAHGIGLSTVYKRMKGGMTLEEAVTTKVDKSKSHRVKKGSCHEVSH